MGKVIMSGVVPLVSVPINASSVLNDNEWSVIREVSDAGQAANLWSIGDRKTIYIKGTVGTVSMDGEYDVFILGINHQGEGGITFGTFKLSDGTDVALVDSYCGGGPYETTKYFSMNHGSETNSGGWKGCDLRYDILGSTDTDSADASEATTTSPVANTLMAAFPADLRAVIRPMIVYTSNTGGSNAENAITTTVDYLPLLAEFEVIGERNYANIYEQNYQQQYEYYKAGNSPLKQKHTDKGGLYLWRFRSPSPTYSDGFIGLCNEDGYVTTSNYSSLYSYGIAPIFRV